MLFVLVVGAAHASWPAHDLHDTATSASAVHAADLDGDGDLDLISGSVDGLAWYPQLQPGVFGRQRIVWDDGFGTPDSVWGTDLDSDGDADLLITGPGETLSWFENLGGGTFGPQTSVLAVGEYFGFVAPYDLDLDGDPDLLVRDPYESVTGDVHVIENLGGGVFGPLVRFATINRPRTVHAADFDGDGDLDPLTASYGDGWIAWIPHQAGMTPGTLQLIADLGGAEAAVPADLDGDGDPDVVACVDTGLPRVSWFENLGGSFGAQQAISVATLDCRELDTGDVDGDGDIDVIPGTTGNDDQIWWFENLGSGASWGPRTSITTDMTDPTGVFAVDLDGNGTLDVASGSAGDHAIGWSPNTGGGAFDPRERVTAWSGSAVVGLVSGDMDLDGDDDAVTLFGFDGQVAFHENLGGSFALTVNVSDVLPGTEVIDLGDLDGDGDLDVLLGYDGIGWIENLGGSFGPVQSLSSATWASDVEAADLDGDGDDDLVAGALIGGVTQLVWFENLGGAMGPVQVIDASLRNALTFGAADFDGDGDVDVVVADNNNSALDGVLLLYDNLGGGTFAPPGLLDSSIHAVSVSGVFDLHGDGLPEVVYATGGDDPLWQGEGTWVLANTAGGPGPVARISREPCFDAEHEDLDGDGDRDLWLVCNKHFADDEVRWLEALGGGAWAPAEDVGILGLDGAIYRTTIVQDLDGDGDADVIHGASRDLIWFENDLLTADGDGDGVAALADCDDTDPLVFPGAPELCGDAVDNDCNTRVDDCMTTAPPVPGIAGVVNSWTVAGAVPGATVDLFASPTYSVGTPPGCPVATSLLASPQWVGSAIADGSGQAVITATVPAAFTGALYAQAVDIAGCNTSNAAVHAF